jgi:hypothetical protein
MESQRHSAKRSPLVNQGFMVAVYILYLSRDAWGSKELRMFIILLLIGVGLSLMVNCRRKVDYGSGNSCS